MAKGKKKDKSGRKRNRKVANRAMVGTFAGGLLGKVVEKVLADTILDYVHPKHLAKHGRHAKSHPVDANGEDVAAKLLEALAGGGPRSIPQLLADTQLGLSPVLHALQTLREFRLINLVGEPGGETVEVTRSGAETVTVFRQIHIREEAARLLA